MGAFGGLILTNKGRALQAKAQSGTQLKFTRIGVGDGSLSGQSITELNTLISEKKSLNITKLKTQSTDKAVVGGILTNQDIATGFYFREIGVFAQDPDVGEVLYCYGNAGAGAEYIPPGGGADIVEKSIDIVTIVGNASNVSATIDNSLVYATYQDLLDHEQSPAPHTGHEKTANKGQPNGYAALDPSGKVPVAQVPDVNWVNIIDKPTNFTPSAHKGTHAKGGSDPITPADIGAEPALGYTPVNKAGDIVTEISVQDNKITRQADGSLRIENANGYVELTPKNTSYLHLYTDRPYFYLNKEVLINANKVWHGGNDGNGSGLDSDLLDGKHAYQFSNSISVGSTADPNTTQEAYILTNHANSPDSASYWHIRTFFYNSLTGNRAQIAIRYNGGYNEMYIRSLYGSTWTAWNKLWHNGNSGSGSGLNADLLDGYHANAFASAGHTHSTSSITDLRINSGQFEYLDGGVWKPVSAIKSVQRGVYSHSDGFTGNITITSVDLNKAFVNVSFTGVDYAYSSGMSSPSVRARLTSATNLELYNVTDNYDSNTIYVAWEVIEYV